MPNSADINTGYKRGLETPFQNSTIINITYARNRQFNIGGVKTPPSSTHNIYIDIIIRYRESVLEEEVGGVLPNDVLFNALDFCRGNYIKSSIFGPNWGDRSGVC